ncbi:rab-like protein 6 isoform x1 [Limosa lapponica baueri]|uniref:Rab-like protein 6 isoform x1 n=1 Tax=Limosa lapponica baueri TaxID=1758121 RepID=A0A2I0TFA2_LIMLA|nr:rab-like protein 6 isoform x1 [Limosa lapponica baueri]
MMEARSRGHASPLATNGQSPSSGSQSPVVPPSSTSTGSSSPGTPACPRGPAAACAPASGSPRSAAGCSPTAQAQHHLTSLWDGSRIRALSSPASDLKAVLVEQNLEKIYTDLVQPKEKSLDVTCSPGRRKRLNIANSEKCSPVQPQQLEIDAVCEARCLSNAGQPESSSLVMAEHMDVLLKKKKEKEKSGDC